MSTSLGATEQQFCHCGSGLRLARCCALDLAALSPPKASRHLGPLVECANAALDQGDTAIAETLCLEVLELAPGREDALGLLFRIRRAANSLDAAEVLARRIVSINPNNFWATRELALILLGKGELVKGEVHARSAVRIAPRNPQAHNLMGMILTDADRPQMGEYHYRRALELTELTEQADPILLANLAWNLKNQGRMAEARELYERSFALRPDTLQTLLGWALLEEADRQFAAAAEVLGRAARVAPDYPGVQLSRAVLHERLGEYDEALAVLADIEHRDPGGLGPNELLEKGRLLDRIGRYAEAWAAFVEGKRRLRLARQQSYLADFANDLGRRLRDFFTDDRLATLPRPEPPRAGAQPLFILGFPRSGTTLLEQMLSEHPRIAAGGELPLINDIANIMPRLLGSPLTYPEALAELWMGDQRAGLDNLRDYYLQQARQLGVIEDGTPWFTDKSPLTELSLGLIGLILPAAPLILMLRHPLDVVVSVFSNYFDYGYYCAFDLETVARHYLLVMEMSQHYRREMALRCLPVRYEDVVDHQEASLRRILDFIGEDFAPRCLRFEENTRYARTASYAQVTERLYDRARYRYRNYLTQLAPVIPILQPMIERLGYSVEDAA
jgi:tetratricopeptide (TPR) repeat protein